MATTTGNGKYPVPVQSTAPPDVVKWLTDGLNAVDAHLTTASTPIKHIQYGPVASVPATLPVGGIYVGY